MAIWFTQDSPGSIDGVFSAQKKSEDSFRLYFNMPRKIRLIGALNDASNIYNVGQKGAFALWNQYFGISNNKISLDDHDANPAVDHSGLGRTPRG